MRRRTQYAKLSAAGWIEPPVEGRRHLGVGPGDRLHYVVTPDGVRIDRASPADEDPLVAFTERAGNADDEDYAAL